MELGLESHGEGELDGDVAAGFVQCGPGLGEGFAGDGLARSEGGKLKFLARGGVGGAAEDPAKPINCLTHQPDSSQLSSFLDLIKDIPRKGADGEGGSIESAGKSVAGLIGD